MRNLKFPHPNFKTDTTILCDKDEEPFQWYPIIYKNEYFKME